MGAKDWTQLHQEHIAYTFRNSLKQDQYSPMTVSEQVISVFTGVKGHLDDVELNEIKKFEKNHSISLKP